MIETILIRTANPHDITLEETEQIAARIRGLSTTWDVRVEGQERTGTGVTLYEVLRISLLGGAFGFGKVLIEEVAKKVADIMIDWARDRFRSRKKTRSIYVAVYGPAGTVKSLVIKNATDEPEDRTDHDQRLEAESRKRSEARAKSAPNKSILDKLELASFTISASGLVFHDALRGPPPGGENTLATVAVVDTATPQGKQQIRSLIGPTAEEVLAPYPQRFVIYSLQHEGAWIRVCADEDLVIFEVLKLVRNPPEPPAAVDVLLFLEPAFHQRVNKAVADEALRRSSPGGSA